MKKIFTSVILAGAMLSLACAVVPASGQEKAVMMTDKVENLPALQLRADEALPDSAVVYSSTGEKLFKHVYLPDDPYYGLYEWKNGTWDFLDSIPSTGYFSEYDREIYNVQAKKVSYEAVGENMRFYCPWISTSYSYAIHPISNIKDIKTGYDANGNLTSLRYILNGGGWIEFTVTYNAGNNPVSIEEHDSDGIFCAKVYYEYNNYGYATLFDEYNWDYEKNAFVSGYKEIAEYDAQGKILFTEAYRNGEIASRRSYEYYDETHFSSISYAYGSYSSMDEYKYDADGRLEAMNYYRYGELQEYVIFYYGNSSSVEAVPESVARVWSSGGQLYIAGTASGTAQVYTVAGQLLKTVPFTSGQTTATPLPRGIYIVAAAGRTWKVVGE
ncbi:MAG: hypothetical protein LBP64_11490 [Tannerella sp.]|jgi:hypothetical protein|nr:hypothetical protein [Tannerella sp.]